MARKKKKSKTEIERYLAGPGARYDDDMAETLGRHLEQLGHGKAHDAVAPEELVESARDEDSPVHDLFDWDDSEAGEKWRVHQARNHINRLRVKIRRIATPTKAMHAVQITRRDATQTRGYAPATTVASVEDLRRQTIDRAWLEIIRWRQRYSDYREVFGEIMDLIEIEQERRA